jgi:hypothetical protein
MDAILSDTFCCVLSNMLNAFTLKGLIVTRTNIWSDYQ